MPYHIQVKYTTIMVKTIVTVDSTSAATNIMDRDSSSMLGSDERKTLSPLLNAMEKADEANAIAGISITPCGAIDRYIER
jgi:hypothetical protein